MAVSGLPETCDNHAKCIARLALDMMDMAKNVKMGPKPMVSSNQLQYAHIIISISPYPPYKSHHASPYHLINILHVLSMIWYNILKCFVTKLTPLKSGSCKPR